MDSVVFATNTYYKGLFNNQLDEQIESEYRTFARRKTILIVSIVEVMKLLS